MGVYIYINAKINYELLDSIPENTTNNISFYLYNYGVSPSSWSQRLTDINLIKKENTISAYANGRAMAYLYDTNLTLEQVNNEVFLYNTTSGKPANSKIFARTKSVDQALIACSKCELEYESADTCTLTLYLVPTTIKINIINHASPASIISLIPSSGISSISIINDQNDTIFNYTPTKVNNSFVDDTKTITMNYGIPLVFQRNEDDIYLYRANSDKSISAVYRASLSTAMARYLSVERIKFTYVSDYEVDMDIYFTSSHGRIVEYYAIYSYTMMVPDNMHIGDEENEEGS